MTPHVVTVLDGGMGKELRRLGAPFRQPEWSALALMEAPHFVEQAHTNFVAAGADVVTTSNYAVVPFHLGEERFDADCERLVAIAGRCARTAADAADRPVRVAGSLPPLDGSYRPDLFDAARAPAAYDRIIGALDPFVDLWLAETLGSVHEAATIVEAVERHGDGRPLWVSFTLPERDDLTDDDVDAIARLAADHPDRIDAILLNCARPERMAATLARLDAALVVAGATVRRGVYANAFPEDRDDDYAANAVIFERRADLTAQRYADMAQTWIDAGASIVGGCCDVYPDDIAELARRVRG